MCVCVQCTNAGATSAVFGAKQTANQKALQCEKEKAVEHAPWNEVNLVEHRERGDSVCRLQTARALAFKATANATRSTQKYFCVDPAARQHVDTRCCWKRTHNQPHDKSPSTRRLAAARQWMEAQQPRWRQASTTSEWPQALPCIALQLRLLTWPDEAYHLPTANTQVFAHNMTNYQLAALASVKTHVKQLAHETVTHCRSHTWQ